MTVVSLEEQEEPLQVSLEDQTIPDPVVHQRGVTASMVAIDKGEEPVSAYQKATESSDLPTFVENWNQEVTQGRMENIQNKLGYSSTEEISKDVEDLSTNLSGEVDHGNYLEQIKAMPSSIGKSETQVSREAVIMQLRETMGEFSVDFSAMSVGEIAENIGGILITKRSAVSHIKLMQDMGFVTDLSEQASLFVDPTESILKMRNMFFNLDEEGQVDFMELLSEHLPNASENPLIRAELAHNILGSDFKAGLSSAFNILEFVDVLAMTKAVTALGHGMVKSGGMLNVSKRMGEPELAADVIEQAVANPEAAAKVGVTPADTADAINPLVQGDIGTLLTGASEDAAASTQQMINLQNARFKAATESVERHGLLDDQEVRDVLRAAEIKQLEQPGVIESTVDIIDESGFKLSWTEAYFDSIGRLRQKKQSKTVDFTINDIGEFRSPVAEWVDKGLTTLDPNARMTGKLRQWFVSDVESMARKQEQTSFAFDAMMKDAFSGLDKAAAMNVDHALQQGSKQGRTYTFEDLTNGATGRTLTDKEARAYIGTRNVVEKLYTLKNKQIVDNYLAKGINLFDGKDGVMPVRSYDDWSSANVAWKQVASDSHHILVPEGNLSIKGAVIEQGLMPLKGKRGLTKAMLQDAYEKGYVLARNSTQSSFFKKGEVKTQWAFVKAKKVVSPRGQQVIHRIEGYMPKQRTGAYWFIKKNKNVGLSGADNYKTQSTAAYSDTAEGASEWVAKQEHPDAFEIVFDREMTASQRMHDVAGTHGGMYAGSRKSEELEFVGRGDVSFADSFEAMQHYINHIGRQYPASLYRMGSEERLIKIAKGLGASGRDLSLHNVVDRVGEKFPKTSREYKMVKGIHDQLSFVNMIPTDEELAMANRWRTWGKMMEGPILDKIPGWNRVPKLFYQRAAKNSQPVDVIRGITFNHLLGMYNPAQVIVQWSGALVSFGIDPLNFPKHTAKAIGWGGLDQIASDPIKQAQMMKWMKKNGLGDYADEYELWSKSGFRESVEQGNADYTSVFTRNMPYDENVLRKVLANHTLFYKAGELVNTRTAFATSISRYKKTHGVDKIDPNDSKALEEVGLWAEKFRLNMSRANQSSMNKGLKAAPLQFQQVISKYFEKILPQAVGGTDELSSWEKARLFGITTAATGAVGVPMGQFVMTQLLNASGVDPADLDEETILSLKYGTIGWMNNEFFDMNVNFSDRMTLGGDILRNTYEALTTSKATWEWLGASGTVIDRYARNGQFLAEALDLTQFENKNPSFESVMAMPAIILEAATDIPTVTRNMKQYYSHLFSNNPAFIKDGKYMWDWETMNKKTAFIGMMGFQPTEMSEMYELDKELRDSTAAFAQWGDADADVILRIFNTRLLTSDKVEEGELYADVVNAMIHKYGPIEQMKLMDAIYRKTSEKRMDQGNLMYKWLLESESKQEQGLNTLNQLNSLVSRKQKENQ